MNERIKELAEQAGFNFRVDCACDDEIVRIYKTADKVEKFAELIVRECLDMIYDNNIEDGDRALGAVADMISKHFGVE